MSEHIAVFYHVWCSVDSNVTRILIDEQLKRLYKSGIINHASIYCCVAGSNAEKIRAFIEEYDWIKILISTTDESKFEGETLEKLYDICCSDPSIEKVAYIHTKGIRFLGSNATNSSFKAVNSWRHFLEWGTIDLWKEAIAQLADHDAVGVNYRRDPWPHFGGNFWWATSRYVKSLIRPKIGEFPPGNYAWLTGNEDDRLKIIQRLDFERWIGLNDPSYFSFFGYPFKRAGIELPGEYHNLYERDIYPYLP